MDAQLRKSARRIIRKDKRMVRLKESFSNNPIYSLPFEDLKAELKMLHNTRTVHKLNVKDPSFVDKLSKSSITDHSIRSRITEILVDCASIRSSLNRTIDALEAYILNEYSDHLRPLKTKDERRSFIAALLEPYHAYLSDSTELVQICQYYLDCIDKSGFMTRDLVSAYTLVRKYEPS